MQIDKHEDIPYWRREGIHRHTDIDMQIKRQITSIVPGVIVEEE